MVYTWYLSSTYRMSAFNIRIQCLFLANYSSCILLFAGIMSSAQTVPADPICTRKILFLKCYGNILVIFQVYTCYIPVIYIQKVYAWYIPGIYMVYDHLCRNPGIYVEKTLWVCSVPVTYPSRHVISQEYSWSGQHFAVPSGGSSPLDSPRPDDGPDPNDN